MTDLLNREIEMEHPHAEFLRAIADGDDLDDWLCSHPIYTSNHTRNAHSSYTAAILSSHGGWKVWRKPKTLTYSVTIPEPLTEEPEAGSDIYCVKPNGQISLAPWRGINDQMAMLRNNQLFRTAEEASLAFIRRNNLPTEI